LIIDETPSKHESMDLDVQSTSNENTFVFDEVSILNYWKLKRSAI